MMNSLKYFHKLLPGLLTVGLGGLWACDNADVMDPNEPVSVASETLDGQQTISSDDAAAIAGVFVTQRFGESDNVKSRASQTVETITSADSKPLAYVINSDGGGWVIVSADKRFHPILAYSEGSDESFDTSGMDEVLSVWLEEIEMAMASVETIDENTSILIANEWLALSPQEMSSTGSGLPTGNSPEAVACRNRLKELNDTYYQDGWTFGTLAAMGGTYPLQAVYNLADQYDSPYEYTIVGIRDVSTYTHVDPLISTEWHQKSPYNALCPNQYLAGCIPIAMAQIMNFYKYPAKFDWINMVDNDATVACQQLIADIGRTVGVKYGSEATGTEPKNAREGFKAYGYSAVLKDFNHSDVKEELIWYGRPVFMGGYDVFTGKGHAWVCDGIHQKSNEYEYYAEYLNTVYEYNNHGDTFIFNPGRIGSLSTQPQYHMNWGWKRNEEDGSTLNGWYIEPNPGDRYYNNDRKIILVHIQ